MTYGEATDWLFEQFPAYQKIGQSAYKPDLDNITSLCRQMQIDFEKLRYIHIAGTNGKGSTSSMLASVFIEKKIRTGLFTSPHIHDFRERITVDGVQIPEQKVIDFCEKIRSMKLESAPSFFEITWALALEYFIEQSCEICVIETGLGGRLDATNIITPLLSVITNISLDHTAILGNTRAEIAFEKAGIIKKNVPVVIGERHPDTWPVFREKAKEQHSQLYLAEDLPETTNFIHADGTYQRKNERTVRKALEVLGTQGFSFSQEEVRKGILNVSQNTGFRGRFQVLAQSPLTIVDAAHNEDGIRQLLRTLEHYGKGQLHIVYGTSSDKDLSQILSLFPRDARFFLTEFSNPRSAKTEDLRSAAKKLGLNASFYEDVQSAVEAVQQIITKEDTLLITGSFFLLSDFF